MKHELVICKNANVAQVFLTKFRFNRQKWKTCILSAISNSKHIQTVYLKKKGWKHVSTCVLRYEIHWNLSEFIIVMMWWWSSLFLIISSGSAVARNEVAKFWSNLRLSQHTPATKMTKMIVMSRVTDDDFDDHGDRDAALFFVFPSTNKVWQKCWTVSHQK